MNDKEIIQKLIQVGQMLERGVIETSGAELDTKYYIEQLQMSSLKDRLFKLANDFAIDKQGDVAVKLHSIHNKLL